MDMVLIILATYVLDLILGDPKWLPHPVRWIGWYISFIEGGIRRVAKTSEGERIGGVILFVTVIVMVFGFSYLSLSFSTGPLRVGVALYLAYTSISVKSLRKEVEAVTSALDKGYLNEARQRLSHIVGRDTRGLTEEGIHMALIETTAESTSDGIIAPLFYLVIGGPILALVYKAINTLDSMVGYKDERYKYLGWLSAKADDVVNYIPSRLTALFMAIASFFLGLNWKGSAMLALRDGRKHTSPNAGYPEAAAAGGLGVQLGGGSYYGGLFIDKPVIGKGFSFPVRQDVSLMIKLMYITSLVSVLLILSFILICSTTGKIEISNPFYGLIFSLLT